MEPSDEGSAFESVLDPGEFHDGEAFIFDCARLLDVPFPNGENDGLLTS